MESIRKGYSFIAAVGPCLYASFSHLPQVDTMLGSFYNPNIEPPSEWINRAQSFLNVCELLSVSGEVIPELPKKELHELLFSRRCAFCYDLRLTEAASRQSKEVLTCLPLHC